MRENEWIGIFAGIHGIQTHRADAERCGNLLLSMDSFSETEDFFTATTPETIGHNMAAGACSDLLACGVKPEILQQAWNIDPGKGVEYYRKIARGIEKVLRHYGAKCIGGDLGTARPWSWTAAVLAHCAGESVTRAAQRRVPFDLYLSGPMGEANLAAFRREAMPELPLRDPVPPGTLFATDSSGGFFDALENFRRVHAGMRLDFEMSQVISPRVFEQCPAAVDPVCTLIGGVGEYELVYAVPRGAAAPGIRIGEGDFSDRPENDFSWTMDGKTGGRMTDPPPDYRSIPPDHWFGATHNYLREMSTK